MTPAQRTALLRLAARATDRRGKDALVAYVDGYRHSPQPTRQPDGTHAFAPVAQPCDPERCSLWTRIRRRFG